MDKGLISFPWNVSGLLTIGISIRILSLKLKGTTLSLSVALRARIHISLSTRTHTTCMLIRFHTLMQTLIALSLRPNKKITNKPHCLFPQRISIRHKSAYTWRKNTHTHTHTHINMHIQGSGARFHHCEVKGGRRKQRRMTLTLIPPAAKLSLSAPLALFLGFASLSLVSSYLRMSLKLSDFPIPMPVAGAASQKKQSFHSNL